MEASTQGKREERVGSKKGEENIRELLKPSRRAGSRKCQGTAEESQISCHWGEQQESN